jgi:hypothetical protein
MSAPTPVPPSAPVQPAAPAGPKPLTALAAAGNTAIVGTSTAALAVWLIETYWKPGGAPLPDWVAALLGGWIASAATYLYHVGSALFQKWVNAKLGP